MSERMHALAQLLFGKSSIDDCSQEEVQQLANQYPYFSPAQFALLQKLKDTDQKAYNSAAQKGILYYSDPLQFENFISSGNFLLNIDLQAEEQNSDVDNFPAAGIPALTIAEELDTDMPEEQPEISQNDFESVPGEQVEDEGHNPEVNNFPSPDVPVLTLVEDQDTDLQEDQPEFSLSEFESDNEPNEQIDEEEKNVDISDEEFNQNLDDVVEIQNDASENQEIFVKANQENLSNEEFKQDLAEAPEEPDLKIHIPTFKEPAPANNDLVFEPFHTVDYFASQGIKPGSDEKPKDKFGQQLRSFTDWLKVMKKLPATEVTSTFDANAVKKVEHLAAHSVDEANVVTEAMAEVWLKQGNKEKAIETYNKLSLLNPSKKAFFAAKIENLKQP